MIIYHAITTYHILKAALHKLNYHTNEKAILLVPSFLRRCPIGLTKTDLFNKVVFFKWDNKFYADDNENSICERIDKELFASLCPYSINDVQEINVFSAAYSFGAWLCHKGIHFNWFEEADGRFSDSEPIMRNDAEIAPIRYSIALKYDLYNAQNPLIENIYINVKRQTGSYKGDNIIDFDVTDEIRLLNDEAKKKLLDFFGVPESIQVQPNSILLLTQHFHGLRMMSWEEHVLCYQMTCDFFLDGYSIYCKIHPSDLMPYEEFLSITGKLSGDYPSELLPLVTNAHFEIGASISSTGILNLSSIFDRMLLFDENYVKTFLHNIYYYGVLKIASKFLDKDVYVVGSNETQFQNLIDFGDTEIHNRVLFFGSIKDIPENRGSGIVVVCSREQLESVDLAMAEAANDDIYVFCADGRNACYNQLRKTSVIIQDMILSSLNNEVKDQSVYRLFVLSKNRNYLRSVAKMKYEKDLINTGIKISVNPTPNDADSIILKGMLKATEEQLQIYVDENTALKRQLESELKEREH